MEEILKYFTYLTDKQKQQFAALFDLYKDWNEKINVISRKDIDNLYLHHVLHSLAIAKAVSFRPGTRILDFGTGGGFPGIPLAILFPETQFKMIDGTGKKIRVVNEVATAIGLENVEAVHLRGEEEKGKYDFVAEPCRDAAARPHENREEERRQRATQLHAQRSDMSERRQRGRRNAPFQEDCRSYRDNKLV